MALYLLLTSFIGGLAISVYPRYATRRGWRVWPSLRRHGSPIASIGFASLATAAILIVLRAEWWEAILLLVIGIGIGFVLLRMLKSTAQAASLALIAFGWLWFLLLEMRW